MANKPELNYYPQDIDSSTKEGTAIEPQANMPNVADTGDVKESAGSTKVIKNSFQSGNYIRDMAGWLFGADGIIRAIGVVLSGTITAVLGYLGGWVISATKLTSTSGNVELDSTNETITVGTITIDGASDRIRSSNYVTGVSGFTIEPNLVEAENIIARGTMSGSTFKYDVISAVGGQMMVADADALASDMTALDSSPLVTRADTTFVADDILIIRGITALGIQEEWLRVEVAPGSYDTGNTLVGTGANDSAVGTVAWTNPTNITADDGVYATVTINTGGPSSVADLKARIIKSDGSIGTTDKSQVGNWAAADTVVDYGGAADLWGETWTPSDINDADFGFALQVEFGVGAKSNYLKATNLGFTIPSVATIVGIEVEMERGYGFAAPLSQSRVDYVKIKVTYTIPTGTYVVTRDLATSFAADTNPIWQAGTPVVKQGTSDGAAAYSGGWLRLLGEGTNSPYYSVFSRTGVAYSAYAERLRLGNLNGWGGFSSDVYGIAAGNYALGKYLTYDETSGDFVLEGGKITGVTADTTLSRRFSTSTTDIHITNTTTETTIFTKTLDGGTLGTANIIQIRFYVGVTNMAGGGNIEVRVNYGSTEVAIMTCTGHSSGAGASYLDVFFYGAGATNAQTAEIRYFKFPIDSIANMYNNSSSGTATEDSTGDLTLEVTWKWTVASANNNINVNRHIATIISG